MRVYKLVQRIEDSEESINLFLDNTCNLSKDYKPRYNRGVSDYYEVAGKIYFDVMLYFNRKKVALNYAMMFGIEPVIEAVELVYVDEGEAYHIRGWVEEWEYNPMYFGWNGTDEDIPGDR